MQRRKFLKTIVMGSTLTSLGLSLSACNDDDTPLEFTHGVASGDPLDNSVIIWTRAVPVSAEDETIDSTDVHWEMALTEDFSDPVASGTATTSAEKDYTVKVDVSGLLADTTHFYRFFNDSTQSLTGTTRTLPVDTNRVKLAVFSCANYPAGYFHVYQEAAKRDDLNAVLHLGDYIYEYEKDGYASEDAETLGRVSDPQHEIITLTDYRRRYAQYRTDSGLVSLHQKVPFIQVWDDHEIANDVWKEGAENHSADEGDFQQRVDVALQAFYEWLPVREAADGNQRKIYRSFNFGNLLSLHMLDTRLIGRDQQLDYVDYFDASGQFSDTQFVADLTAADRSLLGDAQRQWLQTTMAQSQAVWQVLGQQVLMGRMKLPAPVALQQISLADYTALAQLAAANPKLLTAQQQAVLAAPGIPYNLDAWDGYFVEREQVLGTALALDKNLVVLSGDTHNAWANNLQDMNGNQVGVEFATSSVSSPGFEEYLDEDPDTVTAGVTQIIPGLVYADTEHRGYMVLDITANRIDTEWIFIDTVKSTDYSVPAALGKTLRVLPGAGNRKLQAIA